MTHATFQDLPQIDALLRQPLIAALSPRYNAEEITQSLRALISEQRALIQKGTPVTLPDFTSTAFATKVTAHMEARRAASLRPVINATGILIHTNLGRARLAPRALDAIATTAAQTSNLELNLGTGKRGSRHTHVERLICDLTGAEAAVVVNNCAAAVLLSLMATAAGRTVVASRGELIEIGGSFRLPDVIAQSGATLREVGATNKTRTSDYADAIAPDTAVLLKSHTSNFKIIGFTATPDRRDLAKLAQERNVILMEDLGSGVLIDLSPFGLPDEPVVRDILASGVDLVMFSGDKLLGGPQAGIIAGRRDIIDSLKSHPLMRAVRIDKLSLAALEATLQLYAPPFDPVAEIPVLQMLSEPILQVAARAEKLAQALRDAGSVDVTVQRSEAQVGGGTLPGQDLDSCAVALRLPHLSAEALSTALRQNPLPIIGRVQNDQVLLDMRTAQDADVPHIIDALRRITT